MRRTLAHGISARSVEQRSRQARALSIYFARVFLVYFRDVGSGDHDHLHHLFPLAWIASVWGNCEGLVSAMICMSKRDIGEAVANLLSCGGRLWLSLTRVSAHDAQCPGTVLDIDLPAEDKAQGGRPSQG